MFQTASEWVCPDGFPNLSNEPEIAIDLETRDPDLKTLGSGWPTRNGNIIGVAVAASGRAWYFPIRHLNGGNMDPKRVMRWVQDLCSCVLMLTRHTFFTMLCTTWVGFAPKASR